MTNTVHVLELMVELFIESSFSLKDKRRVLKPLIAALKNQFNVSVAEISHQESWQRTELAVLMVSGDSKYLQQQAHLIEKLLVQFANIEILKIDSRIN